MNFFEYLLLAIAFGITLLQPICASIKVSPVRLTWGLFLSFTIALFHSVAIVFGIYIGDIMRFSGADGADLYLLNNQLVFLGFVVFVALRWAVALFRRNGGTDASYALSRLSTVLAFALATSVNLLLLSIGAGFVAKQHGISIMPAIPVFVVEFLFSYLAVMLGRQHSRLRSRRWQLLAIVLLLTSAVLCVTI